ncbi:MAG TPA: PH domain-containing protein [Cyclobacteriaceae bacterium]|nr:PH domain-containing protein [Cyclobacteriaceae bacterium]
MKTYRANRKGPVVYILLGGFIYFVILYFIHKDAFSEKPYLLIPFFCIVALGLWVYFDTSYRVKEGKLIYKVAFFSGKININDIREILIGSSIWGWAGIKPALSSDGIIIKYNRFDDVFIAPENKEELIADLLELNGTIKLTKKEEA